MSKCLRLNRELCGVDPIRLQAEEENPIMNGETIHHIEMELIIVRAGVASSYPSPSAASTRSANFETES
jgi:hypothetical protein